MSTTQEASLSEVAQKLASDLVPATYFTLADESTQIVYSTANFLPGSFLSYCDPSFNRTFLDPDIRLLDSEIGQLVTVTLEHIPDLRIVTFTLLLPVVRVSQSQPLVIPIAVTGVITTTPMNFGGFPMVGPEKTYRQLSLRGTAQFVVG
ncbi:MAG: hypothetical protein ACFB4I_21185 [Cyanophyceae cyanobacterium]